LCLYKAAIVQRVNINQQNSLAHCTIQKIFKHTNIMNQKFLNLEP
jgi:hypothetical protein